MAVTKPAKGETMSEFWWWFFFGCGLAMLAITTVWALCDLSRIRRRERAFTDMIRKLSDEPSHHSSER
jgi:archaellum biogenesis protein FlaJ (TadC family)